MSVIDYIRNYPATSCRMHFGDTIIEELIPGYKTNYVSGRDSMMADVYEIDTEVRSFSRFRRRKRLKRELTVGFVIVSTTPEAYHKACNKLKSLLFSLDSDDQEIWFEDESDVFYKGTVTNVTCDKFANISTGGGSITITCSDPRKYAREETEVEIQNGSFLVDYAGTYPSYPIFEATCNGSTGYISFIDKRNNILQFGNPLGEEELPSSVTRVSQKFNSSVPSDWVANVATLSTDCRNTKKAGSVRIGTSGLTVNSYGSWSSSDPVRHGPTMTKQIPTTLSNPAPKNWQVTWKNCLYSTNNKARSELQIIVAGTNAGGTMQSIAEIHIYKPEEGNNKGQLYFYVNDKHVGVAEYTIEQNNSFSGVNAGSGSISKVDDSYTFSYGGKTWSFKDITALTATEVSLCFFSFGTTPTVTENSVSELKLISYGDDVDSVNGVSNVFLDGDKLVADCSDGKVVVNDLERYGVGAIGNDWEKFYLVPGTNEIQCLYPDGVTAPEFKMRYREVYL